MAELHAGDLRFTPEEAAAFLGGAMGLDLSAGGLAALEGVTVGLDRSPAPAALSMRKGKDVSAFVRSFSGSHRDVFDFLAEEVFQRQTEQVQTFLLEATVLDSLSGPLWDALTGRKDGQARWKGSRGRICWSSRWTITGFATVTITSSPTSYVRASDSPRPALFA
jgi:LuxR family transcriptional regulator, maltose regulon positive regulatory protein